MMRFVLYTNTISPHQLPLAREVAARVGDDNFRYIYTDVADKDHGGLGWTLDVPKWCVHAGAADVGEWIENADVLLSGLRCFDLFERRANKGLKNFYMTERWFKPPLGIARLLHPRYFGYARRLCNMMESGAVVGLPIGIHAARDMARLCGLMHGDLRCLFGVPEVEFDGKPGGEIWLKNEPRNTRNTLKFCLAKMWMWGYFVEECKIENVKCKIANLKALWVGRLLDLKRADTIIRAVGELAVGFSGSGASTRSTRSTRFNISLDVYGTGPEEARLKGLGAKYGDVIKFHPPVGIGDVRRLMREHDVYVLASNGYEGWGAVVSEALEEGMKVLGTYEAGSSATMLDENCLFRSGDWRRLRQLLEECAAHKARGELRGQGIGEWTAAKAAERLLVGVSGSGER